MGDWYAGKTVLVTGATSGIGRIFALELARRGARVVATGRNREALAALVEEIEAAGGPGAASVAADLGRPEAVSTLIREVMEHHPPDILVNNAGFGHTGPFEEMSEADLAEMAQVNSVGLAALCRGFLPGMADRAGTGILNVGSIASFFPTPGSALYGASKAFVLSFTDALHQEMKGRGVHICGVYPGHVHTGFLDRSTAGRNPVWSSAMQPIDVVLPALSGLAANRMRVVPGLGTRIKRMIAAVAPVSLLMLKSHASAKRYYAGTEKNGQ